MTAVDIFVTLIAIWIIAIFLRAMFAEQIDADGFEFVNPVYLYGGGHLNWFGAIFIALIWNALFAPFAIFYWIYKLCTVGRKNDKN